MNILICTLGASWAVVPEIWGLLNTAPFDLYAHHPRFDEISAARSAHGLSSVDEIWCIATAGKTGRESIEHVLEWGERSGITVQCVQAPGTDSLVSQEECRAMTELIFRTVLAARECSRHIYLSLAGGRKTMSADLQRAGSLFGCAGLLHVVDTRWLPEAMRKPSTDLFLNPLPPDLVDALMPLVVGRETGNEVLKTPMEHCTALRSPNFPLPAFFPAAPQDDFGDDFLVDVIEDRIRQSSYLLVNFNNTLLAEDRVSNFLSLYRLPSDSIKKLKATRFGLLPEREQEELAFLKQLPKVELHCHMGGIANPSELIETACACETDDTSYPLPMREWRTRLQKLIAANDLAGIKQLVPDPKQLRTMFPGVREPFGVVGFLSLFKGHETLLENYIFGSVTKDAGFFGIDIGPYEQLGDLQGSGLLQCEPAIRQMCRILKRQCKEHNVRYLELRCSPVKYTRGGLQAEDVVNIILDELDNDDFCTFRLIFIASRHGTMSEIYQHIELAMACLNNGIKGIVGFDLAGNESAKEPRQLREAFLPVMEKCLRITIHAGETAEADKIWQALYHLNADRIGHGLTLRHRKELYPRFRDRRIALEMCPSSNMQIVGFKDNYLPESKHLQTYPLQEYMKQGLRVCINTDNPGISRTDYTRELHRACRLTPDGLSIWEVCILIRSGFRAAFAGESTRETMLLATEKYLSRIITEYIAAT